MPASLNSTGRRDCSVWFRRSTRPFAWGTLLDPSSTPSCFLSCIFLWDGTLPMSPHGLLQGYSWWRFPLNKIAVNFLLLLLIMLLSSIGWPPIGNHHTLLFDYLLQIFYFFCNLNFLWSWNCILVLLLLLLMTYHKSIVNLDLLRNFSHNCMDQKNTPQSIRWLFSHFSHMRLSIESISKKLIRYLLSMWLLYFPMEQWHRMLHKLHHLWPMKHSKTSLWQYWME